MLKILNWINKIISQCCYFFCLLLLLLLLHFLSFFFFRFAVCFKYIPPWHDVSICFVFWFRQLPCEIQNFSRKIILSQERSKGWTIKIIYDAKYKIQKSLYETVKQLRRLMFIVSATLYHKLLTLAVKLRSKDFVLFPVSLSMQMHSNLTSKV